LPLADLAAVRAGRFTAPDAVFVDLVAVFRV
jgi:hypothetical protein